MDEQEPTPPTEVIENDVHASLPDANGVQRHHPKFHVHWHVGTRLENHGVCFGYIKEVSILGATLFLDHDLTKVKSIQLEIQVPALQPHTPPHLVDIDCRVVSVIHDSEERMFRTGVQFTRFLVEADKDFLDQRLKKFEVALG